MTGNSGGDDLDFGEDAGLLLAVLLAAETTRLNGELAAAISSGGKGSFERRAAKLAGVISELYGDAACLFKWGSSLSFSVKPYN